MRTLTLLFFGFIIASFNIEAQNSLTWKLVGNYKESNIKAWDIDPVGNLILASKESLYKIDTDFKVLFTQSRSSFGDITKIDARHSLKMLLFSEDQQMLEILDNTLTFQEGGTDLANLSVGFATLVCYSGQSKRFWVYDEQNTRLIRFKGLSSIVKSIEISNIASITRQYSPLSIEENQNQLFLFYKGGGIFIFDYYGSLLQKIEDQKALRVHPTENYIFILRENEMVKISRKNGEKSSIELPIEGIKDFRIFEDDVYFQVDSGIKKFSLPEKTITK